MAYDCFSYSDGVKFNPQQDHGNKCYVSMQFKSSTPRLSASNIPHARVLDFDMNTVTKF